MASIATLPLSRAELARALGHKTVSRALRQALDQLMHLEYVAYTMPEKPNSRLQRYRAVRPNDAADATHPRPI